MNTHYSSQLFWIIVDDPVLYVLALALLGLWLFAIGMILGSLL